MPATEKLFEASGFDFNEWQTKARQPGFKGFSLKSKISTQDQIQIHLQQIIQRRGKDHGQREAG